ncbi:MAG: Fic family protein [Patescibacteria group bacterium]|nr:Fic family protein [Patescibacteria group bacterium]
MIEEKKYTYSLKNEIQEVKNSQQAFDFINQKFVFNQTNIKRLYHILTKSLLKSNGTKYRRGYKILDNVVGNSKTTAPENVDRDMEKLLSWYHENKKITCPFVLAFEFHLRFEQIHPFEDGNGRT